MSYFDQGSFGFENISNINFYFNFNIFQLLVILIMNLEELSTSEI